MLTENEILNSDPSHPPTKGPWIVDDLGRVLPANYKNASLECIAEIQTAPLGPRNAALICAASLMFEAIKAVIDDPKFKFLSPKTKESINEAISAAD